MIVVIAGLSQANSKEWKDSTSTDTETSANWTQERQAALAGAINHKKHNRYKEKRMVVMRTSSQMQRNAPTHTVNSIFRVLFPGLVCTC